MAHKQKLLVTGHTGFVGTYLLNSKPDKFAALNNFEIATPFSGFDVRLPEHWQRLLAETTPAAILHLAAQSHVPTAIAAPAATLETNIIGTAILLQSLKQISYTGRLLYVSSADVYGRVEEADLPITESHPPAPRNPYAVSKLAAETLCRQFNWTENLDIVIARPFNHSGAGQPSTFALSGFARSVAAIALGQISPLITVGDIETSRDFSHVEDILNAYLRLIEDGKPGEIYNICSGHETLLRDALDELLAIADVTADIQVDTTRIRPGEQRRVCGDPGKLIATTNWRARMSRHEILVELLGYWKRNLQNA